MNPSATAAPAPAPPTSAPPVPNTTPSPAPGLDPGFAQWDAANGGGAGATGGTGPWWADRSNSMVVKTNGSYHPNGTEKLMKIGDIMYWFFQWDQKKVDALATKLVKAGMLPSINVTRNDIWEVFRKGVLMDAATAYASSPDKAMGVEQVLQGFMKRPVGDAAEQAKPKEYTTTTSSANISDPTEANAAFEDILRQKLGRAPTEPEKHAFLAALNAAQRANPSVTKTQYTLDEKTGGYNTSVGETTGGVNAGQFADEFAEKNNKTEYGAFQAATTYFDALMGALGAPGGL